MGSERAARSTRWVIAGMLCGEEEPAEAEEHTMYELDTAARPLKSLCKRARLW